MSVAVSRRVPSLATTAVSAAALHRLPQRAAALSRTMSASTSAAAAVAAAAAAATTAPSGGTVFFLDAFAERQWDDPAHNGTRLSIDKAEFVLRLHELHATGAAPLVDGYAPFCKHIFVPNFAGAPLGALRITPDNERHLRSGYMRRRPEELPVLSRWFDEADVSPLPRAAHLDIILYSREQLLAERAALPRGDSSTSPGPAESSLPDAPWGIVSVKAQDEGHETPMQPVTMMRNALGRAEGGSGVPLDRDAYEAAAAYWADHAVVVPQP